MYWELRRKRKHLAILTLTQFTVNTFITHFNLSSPLLRIRIYWIRNNMWIYGSGSRDKIHVRLEISKTKRVFNLYRIRIKLKFILSTAFLHIYVNSWENYDYTTCELKRFKVYITPLGTGETYKKDTSHLFPK